MFVTQIQNDWYSLACDESRRILRLRRSARRSASVAELERTFVELFADLDRLVSSASRGSYSLLQDMRAAPLLDDPEQAAVIAKLAARLVADWRRYAILVQTPIGTLQARRTGAVRADAGGPAVFSDEIEALNYLQA